MDYGKESLRLHAEWKGKIGISARIQVNDAHDLSLAYTPGVAAPCLAIRDDYELSFELTGRANTVAVITDGTAVLGLGDIGAEAGMPVMEGKCLLFKEFGGVDAFPIVLRTKDVEEIVRTVYLISGGFGGINLEDISAPRCFEIEARLKEICDIPVFHDDQHGTAVAVAAALINALKLAGKSISDAAVVINGAGSAGLAIARLLLSLGAENIILSDKSGLLCEGEEWMNPFQSELARMTNKNRLRGSLSHAIKGADVFIGVSAKDCVSTENIKSMADRAIVFPMANPDPEIKYELAAEAGAFIIGTGRSDYPNQINNAVVFPGLFRGALDARARDINDGMKIAAAYAIADSVQGELSVTNIIPKPFDRQVHKNVAKAVLEAAVKSGICRKS